MNKLIMMRHGESIWNKLNLFTGWVDVSLSEKGVQEAIRGGHLIKDIPIDVIFTSTLIRAHMTLFLAMLQHNFLKTPVIVHENNSEMTKWSHSYNEETAKQNIPVICAWQLNERAYGELQGFNKAATAEKYGAEQVHIWRRSYDVAPPGGESLKMTADRTIPYFKEKIVPKLKEGKNVFVSAHGNSLRSIVMYLDKLSEDQVVNLELGTGVPIIYEYDNNKFIKKEIKGDS